MRERIEGTILIMADAIVRPLRGPLSRFFNGYDAMAPDLLVDPEGEGVYLHVPLTGPMMYGDVLHRAAQIFECNDRDVQVDVVHMAPGPTDEWRRVSILEGWAPWRLPATYVLCTPPSEVLAA
jgi:hypothetical protein